MCVCCRQKIQKHIYTHSVEPLSRHGADGVRSLLLQELEGKLATCKIAKPRLLPHHHMLIFDSFKNAAELTADMSVYANAEYADSKGYDGCLPP